MRHLKMISETVTYDDILNSVNWKFVNYLKHKITAFEDAGEEIRLNVVTYKTLGDSSSYEDEDKLITDICYVYAYSTERGEIDCKPLDPRYNERLIEQYNKRGLLYIIEGKTSILEKIYDTIKNKVNKSKQEPMGVRFDSKDWLVVTPK